MGEPIRVVLVASGSGTDADSVMTAYRENRLTSPCEIVYLLSTKESAGCLEKAANHRISTHTITRKGKDLVDFQQEVQEWLVEQKADVVFLLGCIHPMPIVPGIAMYNIHPADPEKHGGQGMYGLAVHEHVLAEILDRISWRMASDNDRFVTLPTVHEVVEEYDRGFPLFSVMVEIPGRIIQLAKGDLSKAAEELQQVVLPQEHKMLPFAVDLLCQNLVDER